MRRAKYDTSKLRHAFLCAGITEIQLTEKVGLQMGKPVSRSTVSRTLRGQTEKAPVVKAMADILDVPMSELVNYGNF